MTGAVLTGAVLTGGSSRRMGANVDKAFVTVDGVAMVRRVADALVAAGAASVVCIGGDRGRLSALGLDAVADRWPGDGPLGGLAVAVDRAAAGRVLVAGCDQPWLDPMALRLLADAVDPIGPGSPAAVFRVGDRVQPLPGCWSTALAAALVRRFEGGHRRLDDALAVAHGLVVIDADQPGRLRDVDRPNDLTAVRCTPTGPTPEAPVQVPEVDVDELASRQRAGTMVIDVRNPDEYIEGHVPGARLIPLPEVPERLAEVPTDQPVLVICKSGGRSLQATEFYVAEGLDATNVAGGTMAWIESGRPVAVGDQPE